MRSNLISPKVPADKAPVWGSVVLLVMFAALMVKIGWVADEGLEVLRTVLNGAHGWTATFNPAEPVNDVQSPLWMMTWTAVGVTGEWVTTMFAASFVLSLVAIGVVLFRARSLPVVIAAAGVLLLSNAFMEFTSSGLEQPLSFTVLALMFVVARGAVRSGSANMAGLCGLTAAAVLLTRPDLVFVAAPVLGVVLWVNRRNGAVTFTALGALALPLVAWGAWAQSTYGTVVPVQIADVFASSLTDLVSQGGEYLWGSLRSDPVTLVVIVVGAGVLLAKGSAVHRATSVGVLAYVAWVALSGGAGLPGQLLAAPFYLTVLAVVDWFVPVPATAREHFTWAKGAADLTVVVAAAFIVLGTPSTVIQAWGTPAGNDTAWAPATRSDQTFVALVTGGNADTVAFSPFQPPSVLLSYDGPFSMASIHAATKAWPVNDNEDVVSQETVPSVCGRRGGNGMLSGPEIQWTTTCP
jgi:arabinofuranosyltransferase